MATTQVVAAAKDIPLGAVLQAQRPDHNDACGHAAEGRDYKPEDAIGRGAITQIPQGEPILDSQLAGLGSGGGLAPTIPDGMRAHARCEWMKSWVSRDS